MPTDDIAISVRNLTKTYRLFNHPGDRIKQFLSLGLKKYHREFTALKDLSFDIRKGETVGIIGRNGSGKSTLLQVICGILSPNAGTLKVNGQISALLELGAGFNPEFTGRENVYFQGALMGFTKRQMNLRFEEIATFADIGDFIEQPVHTYSSGMYARLAFSSSMYLDPDILIIDEILAVGDAPFQAKCIQAFHRLRDAGCTVILVSHDEYMVKTFCNKALYLGKENHADFGECAQIVKQYKLEMEKAGEISIEAHTLDNEASVYDKTQSTDKLFSITSVELFDASGLPTKSVRTGQSLTICFRFNICANNTPTITFAANLYRHDGLYIFGATSLMSDLEPIETKNIGSGTVKLFFPEIKLLSGRYVWRVAINDEYGFAAYSERKHVCSFDVVDNLESIGLLNLDRSWAISFD